MNAHLGIDIGGTWIKYGAIDGEGHILFSDRTPTRSAEGQKATIDGITGSARKLVEWCRRSGHTPLSCGIGSPGTINPTTKKVQPPTPNLTAIISVDLAGLASEATGLPTAIDNDANCAAWAEHCYGAGRGIDDLICITVGSGIGSGFIVDGRIYSGPNGSGGELGHVSIDWKGPLCPCGNRGCVELYASANAMVWKAARTNPELKSIGDIFVKARSGDAGASAVLNESAEQLAFGILNAIQLFDPEAIVIGGGAADADSDGRWIRKIEETIHRHAFSAEGKGLRVGKAALGNDAGFIGAAAIGALHMFKSG